jgi:tetratricopeptide (TPR) repeat protein
MPPVQAESLSRLFTRDQVLRLLGVNESVLVRWEEQGFVQPAREYGFRELVALRTLRELRRSRIRVERIRLILAALRSRLRDVDDPLADLKIFTDGRRVSVQVGSGKMEPLSGQLLLDFDRAEIRRMLEFPASRPAQTQARELAARAQEAEAWFEKGVAAEQSGLAVERAVEAYQRAIEIDPSQASALVNLGTIHYNQRDWAKAEDCYRRALHARPDYALAHFNLGNLYDETGHWHKALEQYLAALAAQPDYPDAHYNIALLHQTHGEPLKAVRHWRAYLKADPHGHWAAIARRELTRLREAAVVHGSR